MSDENTPEETVSAPETGAEAPKTANQEAAKWRTQLRAAEGQRNALQARLDTAHKAIADGVIGETVRPDDFWLLGHTVDDFRDESGELNVDALRARAAEVLQERPNFAAKRFQGTADGGAMRSVAQADEKPSFASLFRNK